MSMYYFNALAGAGKTHALARYADRLAQRGQKVLFIQPTKHLINKTIEDELLKLEPVVPDRAPSMAMRTWRPARSSATSSPTSSRPLPVARSCSPPTPPSCVVPYVQNKGDWVLIVDEVPQVDVFEELNLPETHHLITPVPRHWCPTVRAMASCQAGGRTDEPAQDRPQQTPG